MEYAVFCPTCNCAMARVCVEEANFPWDMKCPNCRTSPLALFYSLGSKRHRLQVEQFGTSICHPKAIKPLPFHEHSD